MKRRNLGRTVPTTVLCLSLVYFSLLVVWTATPPNNEATSAPGESHRTPESENKFRNRQLKHVSSENVLSNDLSQLSPKHLSLDDIFISVKTTRIFHQSRVEVILNTWFRLAKNQVCKVHSICKLVARFPRQSPCRTVFSHMSVCSALSA